MPFLDRVEQAYDEIRAELAALMDEGDFFTPYVEPGANRPSARDVHGMENNPAWGAYYLWKNGEVVAGQAWAFDDSIEHEAWNDSDRPRVILLFDVWRPELSEAERGSIAAMFEAIDAYGPKREWTV